MHKIGYIKKIKDSRYRVFSEKGKNMGTYKTMDDAKERLRQIEFFKRKSPLSKKLSFLEAVFKEKGLAKEASSLRDLRNKFIISFLATSFAYVLLDQKIDQAKISEIISEEEKDRILEEEPSLYADFIASEDMTTKHIVDMSYNFLDEDSKNMLYEHVSELNKIPDPNQPLKEGEVVRIPSSKAIESVGLKIKKKIDENLEVEVVKKKLKPFSVQNVPLEYIANVAEIETYSKLAYDDKDPSKIFSEKNKASGNWTIGFGHMLTKKELLSKKITIDGRDFNWANGLDKLTAQKLLRQDVSKNIPKVDYEKFKVNEDEIKAIISLSFLYGPQRVSEAFNDSIVNGEFDAYAFQKNIKNLKVGSLGGLPARRISEILTLYGIKLPPTKKSFTESIKDYNDFVEGRYKGELVSPTSTSVDILSNVISKFDSVSDNTTAGRSAKPLKMRKLLSLIEGRKIDDHEELIKIIRNLR
jgi:GH24 family phage-related lysozyme (muramidase)